MYHTTFNLELNLYSFIKLLNVFNTKNIIKVLYGICFDCVWVFLWLMVRENSYFFNKTS